MSEKETCRSTLSIKTKTLSIISSSYFRYVTLLVVIDNILHPISYQIAPSEWYKFAIESLWVSLIP